MLWDLSSSSSSSSAGCVADAHKMAVRDVSWAPNNEHRFVTGGDDGKLRFWDTRWGVLFFNQMGGGCSIWKLLVDIGPLEPVGCGMQNMIMYSSALRPSNCRSLNEPESLLELSGHSHWVWRVAYSPFHDPLVLSSSTDTTVCVWFTPALAKAKGAEVKAPAGKAGSSTRYGRHGHLVEYVTQQLSVVLVATTPIISVPEGLNILHDVLKECCFPQLVCVNRPCRLPTTPWALIPDQSCILCCASLCRAVLCCAALCHAVSCCAALCCGPQERQ
jgi:WD40 repeat protein